MQGNYKVEYYKHYGLDKCDVLFCGICGQVSVNLHHIEYGAGKKNDHHSNLLPMCYECHAGHHERNKPTTKGIKNAKENYTF